MNNHTVQLPLLTIEYAPWVAKCGLLAPYGKCQCGCGEDAPIAAHNRAARGWMVDKPVRFVAGHQVRVRPLRPLVERFWEKVDKDGPIHPALGTPCWLWRGGTTSFGYGAIGIGERLHWQMGLAHRVSYELHNGPIPDGLFVLHKCDNPPCVNPTHLFAGTPKENIQDMFAKGRDRAPGAPGEANNNAKLTDHAVREIRERAAQGERQCDLAVEFGIESATINHVVRRRGWKHIP
jgi:hypothetical protein